MKILTTKNEWKQLMLESEKNPVILFQHSATCSISARAHKEIEVLDETPLGSKIYKIIIQNSKDISDIVEEDLKVEHESPQVIIIQKQHPLYTVSLSSIESSEIQKAYDFING